MDIGKTAIVLCGVALLYAAIFGVQMLFGIGPVGTTLSVRAGSPPWFAAAANWVRIDTLLIWPVVIAAGAIAQRLWCRGSRLWTVTFVALPGMFTIFGGGAGRTLAIALLYIATALGAGALTSLCIDGKRPPISDR
jgi:hypothetical protein